MAAPVQGLLAFLPAKNGWVDSAGHIRQTTVFTYTETYTQGQVLESIIEISL